jgi:hypothetical protein
MIRTGYMTPLGVTPTRKDYFISKPCFCRLLRLEPQNAILATVIPVELSVPIAFPRSDD